MSMIAKRLLPVVGRTVFNPKLSLNHSKPALFNAKFIIRNFSDKKNTNETVQEIDEETITRNNNDKSNELTSDEIIKELQKEIKELKEKVIRSYAEEENVRRIAKRDVDNAKSYANSSFAKSLLDVADDLERALTSIPPEQLNKTDNTTLKSLYDGIIMTEKSLQKVFQSFKIIQYGTIGDKFDPTLHDALFQMPNDKYNNNTIIQVLKKGYKLNDRVIRAAQVGTANNTNANDTKSE